MQTRLVRKPRLLLPILTFVLFVAAAALHGAAPRPVRALMWDEQQPEQQRAYGEKFLGEAIAAHLSARPGFAVKNVSLASPSQGLDEVTLNDTDVVIWWSHQKNPFVTDENVERLVTRMRHGSWASLRCIPLTGRGRLCGSCRSGPRTMRSRRFPPRIAPRRGSSNSTRTRLAKSRGGTRP